MWIQTDDEGLVSLTIPEIDEIVEFSDAGTAQVPEDVGETLVNNVESITEKDNS